MKFFLKDRAINCHNKIDISEFEFNFLKDSKKVLRKALDIEDKYELLISTYLELEKDALSITVNHMVLSDFSYIAIQSRRTLINRRLIALLTTARLYIERIPSEVYSCTNSEVDKENVKSYFNEKYDSLREYRFIEALRNSVQHHSLPIHKMSFQSRRTEDGASYNSQHKSSFFAYKSEFEQNKNFKKSVLKEIPEMVDILHEVRVYISAISHIHSQVREVINPIVSVSRKKLEDAISRYKQVSHGDAIDLIAVKEIVGSEDDVIPVLLEWDDVRIALVKKNGTLQNLEKRFIRS